MNIGRTTAIAGLMLGASLLALGGCETTKTRDQIVRTTPHCVDQTVQIYFEPESAAVTSEGRAVLKAAAGQAVGCKVTGVDILGLSDAVGAPDANLQLSKQRGEAVTHALARAGLPRTQYNITAVGEAGAITASGNNRPLRRRVDVVVHLTSA
jgi:peptidoglycan-associated lipoprotein